MGSKPPKKPRTVNTDRKGLLAQRQAAYFNPLAHEDETRPKRFTWTSKATLATGLQSFWHPQRPGRLLHARASVQGNPSSTSSFDVLLNGFSIWAGGELLTIPSGTTRGRIRYCTDTIHFQVGDKLQIQIVATGSATGPAVVEIVYQAEP